MDATVNVTEAPIHIQLSGRKVVVNADQWKEVVEEERMKAHNSFISALPFFY